MVFGFLQNLPPKSTLVSNSLDWPKSKGILDIPDEASRIYWRIHNDLYDLTKFDHPGGNEWISMTQGNDITELFESSHPNFEKVQKLLPKYKVRSTQEKRNSQGFTFDKKGFYYIFRERAWKILKDRGVGPTVEILLIHDALLLSFMASICLTLNPSLQSMSSWILYSIMAGFLLQCLGTCSHNFYHKRWNWRMFTWDLTPCSSFEWKFSHVYSHHSFPNTAYDLECLMLEPYLEYFPVQKSWIRLIFSPIMFQIIALLGMHIQGILRIIRILVGKQRARLENTLPLVLLLLLVVTRYYWTNMVTPRNDISDSSSFDYESCFQLVNSCLLRLNVTYLFTSFFFHNISLGGGHHHPLSWHEGDYIPEKVDWGLFQIISVARFETIDKSVFLTSIAFGNHVLHHLLPTVDHSKLPLLVPAYLETCKEFGVQLDDDYFGPRQTGVLRGWIAMMAQLLRTKSVTTNYPLHLNK